MKNFCLVLSFLVCFFACTAQSDTWWSHKYKVDELENLGVEKLKKEQVRLGEYKDAGIFLVSMGTVFSLVGIQTAMKNIMNKSNPHAGELGIIVGLTSIISGAAILVTINDRLKDINLALKNVSLGSQIYINNGFDGKYLKNQGFQISVCYMF